MTIQGDWSIMVNNDLGFIIEYGPRAGEYTSWATFDFAFFIDQRINIKRTGETPEQAADSVIKEYPYLVDVRVRDAAIAEYAKWER